MNHSEAVKEMAAERYLLDELTPDVRDAFEEHVFDCPQCALDIRSGAAFVDEAKSQLPELAKGLAVVQPAVNPPRKRNPWLSWSRPIFAVPTFAVLLIVCGYQNLVTFPALRTAAIQPRIVPTAPVYGATRGSTHTTLTSDRTHGIVLPIDLPVVPEMGTFVSYSFDLHGPDGKLAWTGNLASPTQTPGGDLQASLVIPGGMLENGTYSMAVSGVGAKGDQTTIERYVFDVVLSK
jgi:hypothetical protein